MTDTATDTTPATVVELAQRIEALEQRLTATENNLSLLVFSGELDKLLAAFTIATGAAACGMKVSMFFTFWATAALKRRGQQAAGKRIVERMFGWMLPGGLSRQRLSRLDMCGLGRWMISREMTRKNVANLEELIAMADDLNVEFNICEMSLDLMGIRTNELIPLSKRKLCGVATFLSQANASQTTLFI